MQIIRTVVFSLTVVLSSAITGVASEVEVIQETSHGTSLPVRMMPYQPVAGNFVAPWLKNPSAPLSATSAQEDPAIQETSGPAVSTTPGLGLLGLGTGFVGPSGTFSVGFAPPDTNAAVGATQIVEVVNLSYAVFDKTTGSPTAGPTSIGNIWSGVDSSCSKANNQSDPVVLYDRQAGRWVLELITTSSPYKFCWAVSAASDATGAYHAYAFTDTAGLPDYAKIGVWTDAYYLSGRQFNSSLTSYLGPKACAVDRAKMIAGSAATEQCFQLSNSGVDGMLPSDLDGASLPPAGAPNYFMLLPLPSAGTSTQLSLYKFHVDFTTPANSTFTGPTNLTVASYTEASSFGAFVPQKGTKQKLDGLGFTLMHRLAYRNFPKAKTPHESLVLTHNVSVGTGTSVRYAPRWYEIRNPGTTPTVYQQGSFAPDGTWRWAASIGMDKVGNIALGYSASSASLNPGIRFTGRVPTDPLGKMETEAVILAGTGSQTGNLSRWGDYSSMSIDPVDDCTFWYSNEYIPSNGSFNWATHLQQFKFTSCK